MDTCSYLLIIFFTVIAYAIYHERDRWNNFKDGTGYIMWGTALLVFGLLFSGFADNHFDIDSALRFLTLEKTQENYYIKIKLVIVAYLLILFGLEICIIVALKKHYKLSKQIKYQPENDNAETIQSSTSNNHKDTTQVYIDEFYNTTFLLKLAVGAIACSPLLFAYAFLSFWKIYEYAINIQIILFYIMAVFFSLIPLAILRSLRKYLFVTVTTTSTGLSARGIFMNISVRWDEVEDIDTVGHILDNFAHVITKRGDFYFRPTMKSKNDNLLSLVKSFTGKPLKWVTSDGSEMAVSFENCNLYNEILNHMKKP